MTVGKQRRVEIPLTNPYKMELWGATAAAMVVVAEAARTGIQGLYSLPGTIMLATGFYGKPGVAEKCNIQLDGLRTHAIRIHHTYNNDK
jgi:hypothetical protein